MEEPKPAETGEPVPTAEKRKTCLNCGFLTVTGRELSRADRIELGAYRRTELGAYWTSGAMPAHPERTECFKHLWVQYDLIYFDYSADGVFDELDRPRDECPGFVSYEAGYTPEKLLKRIEEDSRAQIAGERLGKALGQVMEKRANDAASFTETPEPPQRADKRMPAGEAIRQQVHSEQAPKANRDAEEAAPHHHAEILEPKPTTTAPDRGLVSDPPRVAVLRCDGEFWTIGFGPIERKLKDSKGLKYIAHLLICPNQRIGSLQLATMFAEATKPATEAARADTSDQDADRKWRETADVNEDLDPKSVNACKTRLRELVAERDKAKDNSVLLDEINKETEFITRQLNTRTGLFGRPRHFSTPEEKARKAVSNAISDAKDKILKGIPDLNPELERISTGSDCVYMPDLTHPVTWEVKIT
jgi:hypothetical protein